MTESTVPTVAPDVGALAEQVRRVAHLRRDLRDLDATMERERTAFGIATNDLRAMIQAEEAELTAAENVVRALALTQYNATGELNPTPGVAVKIYETLEYDREVALTWAREKQMALVPESLDRKAFERIAKATPLDFVATVKMPKAQIATDLEKALGGAA